MAKVETCPENRSSFMARLSHLTPDQVRLIDFAYDIAKESHRTQSRDSGERYFEHARAVALILIDECNITDVSLIIAALLHDTVEDTPIFGNVTFPASRWMVTARWRMGLIFGQEVADIVIALTKPEADGVELVDKQTAHDAYISRLWQARPEAVLIKMCDRLSNLRSLGGTTPAKQIKTVKETREVYWHLFTSVVQPVYPTISQYLLESMEKEMTTYGE